MFCTGAVVSVFVHDRWVISFGKKNGLNGILRNLNYCYEKYDAFCPIGFV